jgi:hypothetical protein
LVGVEWFFSGLLIALSVGIAGFTGYVLRRLFRTEPGPAETVLVGEVGHE